MPLINSPKNKKRQGACSKNAFPLFSKMSFGANIGIHDFCQAPPSGLMTGNGNRILITPGIAVKSAPIRLIRLICVLSGEQLYKCKGNYAKQIIVGRFPVCFLFANKIFFLLRCQHLI
jgi:hypothetical protein